MYYDIIIKSKTSFLDTKFTYKSDESIEVGSRVVVPFGKANSLRLGFVIDINENVEDDRSIKHITELIDSYPILSKEQVQIVHYLVDNYLADYSSSIQTMMPPGGIDNIIEYFQINLDSKYEDMEFNFFFSKNRSFDDIFKKYRNKYSRSDIKKLVQDGILIHSYDKKSKASKKQIVYISLSENYCDIKIPANAKNQLAIIKHLEDNKEEEVKKLLQVTKSTNATINTLINKGLIVKREENDYRKVLPSKTISVKNILNEDQEKAIDSILNSDKNCFLLHGITGSGKTEVYLNLVENYLSKGKEAIILVPEISLTPQTIERFNNRFGDSIAVLHSKLSISERYDQWRLIKENKVKIVVGARSAIFAPLNNIGIIIIDEEHENSYKSEKTPKYDAREIARFRCELNDAKLVLGTATPSVDTMYKVYKDECELIRLDKRATKGKLPEVQMVDMRQELKNNNFSMFSASLKSSIDDALSSKEQIILFLNKRGHTSYVFCRSCGYVHRCEACDVSMTYHKYKDLLICHYCGRTHIRKKTCENCGSTFIKEFGAGTEKLEEEAKKLFPHANIFRMDADTISNKKDYENVHKMMNDKEIDILIGTQMLAKGLDFPGVTVVGVIAADLSLNLPDYRASERTFQLLTQVSGRAGRGDKEGKVFFQTYKPENFAIKTSSNHDYYSFFKEEIKNRSKHFYPPFLNILTINIASKDRNKAIKKAHDINKQIMMSSRKLSIKLEELSGPTASVIERINNYYRFNIFIKIKDKDKLLEFARDVKDKVENDRGVYIQYNINPDSIY